MQSKPISYYLAPALLVLGALLVAANWYLDPRRILASAVALLVLGTMTLVLAFRPSASEASRQSQDSIRTGIVFAGLMIVVSLGAKLATALGTMPSADFSERALMVIIGAFLVFTGNAIPKTLKRLSPVPADAARTQSLHRFAGWTWVLAGLAFTVAWFILPVRVADLMTLVLLPGAMIIILAQVVRFRRTRHHAA